MITYVSAFFLLFIALVSCSGSGSDTTGGGAMGLLSIGLTDAPPPRNTYEAIYVTIEEVRVKHEGKAGWDILTSPELNLPQTFNLLDLVGGVIADLGAAEIATGHYNQMRLILGTEPDASRNKYDDPHEYANYLILKDTETQIPLKVPSGNQTGIKLVNGFDIEVSGATELVLDFDALNSVVKAGNSGNWHLKPTIKVIESVVNSVSGMIDDENGDPLGGALVSAQLYTSPNEVERVTTESSDGTDGEQTGSYFMYLPLNGKDTPYTIVATMEGYAPECHVLPSTDAMAYIDVDFNLTPVIPAETGTLSVLADNLPVPPVPEDMYLVYLSIRKYVDCDGDDLPDTMIEVALSKFVNEEGGSISYDPITLPVGEKYEIVASADGAGNLDPIFIDVVAGDNPLDIVFPPAP